MKIKTSKYSEPTSVAQFINASIQGCDYGAHQADATQEILARLVEILAEKNVLSKADVFFIGGGYVPGKEE
jgi:hypothetical protein